MPRPKYLFQSILSLLVLLGLSFQSCQKEQLSYNEHIRPILNKKCLSCHGGVAQMGGFSLLFREDALGVMESGKKAIVPGNANASELIRRLKHDDPELRMPYEMDPLSESEIQLISQWIDQGAKWEDPWAYVQPQMPEIPTASSDWAQTNIDHFILQKLEEQGLSPAEKASPEILARRLSLDLTGLPPKAEWVERYLNDPSDKNFEQLVDTLMASPHFGERWAAMWLDLARYADSKGYEKDPYRNIWQYRDWVINAFNRDLPFDEFTIEQIAGDLLPNATKDQLIATAFHRNTMTNTEGGTEDEEYRVAAIIDRVNTTYEVWMGTTMSCVQCHAHPYDPIRQEEYYQSFAFLNNTKDNDLDSEYPNLEILDEKDAAGLKSVISYIQQLDPAKPIDTEADLIEQAKQALLPKLYPKDCDELHNTLVYQDGIMSNWSSNVNEGKNKRFFFKYEDIDLNGLQAINFNYSSQGNDAQISLRIDSRDAKPIAQLDFSKTTDQAKAWQIKTMSIPPQSGQHDLVFEIINTTGELPEGIVLFKDFELIYKNSVTNPQIQQQQQEILALRQKAELTPILLERSPEFQRITQVFNRGNYLDKMDTVATAVPAVLPQIENPNATRLDFAKWLVSRENPMTSRVIVNRFWEQIFGYGIVESLEDFGTQGLAPTHPELLDYLAIQFMDEHQWSMKSLLKEIVSSAAYQQSSKTTAQKQEIDPYNRYLSRGSRIRLSAEQIRDQALAVSGLLFDTIGGKSVMPPQPQGIWAAVYSGEVWRTAEDKYRHRRGLYTYWRRTSPYPSMLAFDSPSREFCMSRRIRTNTPLQALVTLNDPVYVEAAQALAEWMEKAGQGDVKQAIRKGYQRALIRQPEPETIDILANLYTEAEQTLAQTIPKATTIAYEEEEITITDPMTLVANAILNLDAFIMKE
jgi:hypothetical protein